MRTAELQSAITRAHADVKAGKRGARRELERLQRRYRLGAPVIRYGGTIHLVDSAAGLPRKRSAGTPRRRAAPSLRPYWLLGDEIPHWQLRRNWMPVKNEQQTTINVGPSIDPAEYVRATATLFVPSPWAPDSPGARRGLVAPAGRCIRFGQLVPITDPVVRQNIEHFETVARPLRPEDLPPEE